MPRPYRALATPSGMVGAMAADPSDPTSPGARGPNDDEDEPAWVTRLVAVAGRLGANRTRVRWKLRRWVRGRRAERSWVPRGTASALVAVAMGVVFVAAAIAQPGGTVLELGRWTLATHGGNLPGSHEPVRDLTSLLVHGGLFQLVMAMFTVAMAGGLLERELGGALIIPVFLLGGGAGAGISDWLGRDDLGLGAAAGVIALIGAGAVIGQRAGTRRGLTYRNELLSVGVLVVGFGLFVDTDYRAMVPAALVGAGLGWLVPRAAIAARPWLTRTIALAGLAALIAVVVIAAVPLLAGP